MAFSCNADSFFFFDTLFTICPWWVGPTVRSRIEALLAEDAKKRLKRWFSSCTTRRVTDELGWE
jgi:hypothetical protein